MWVAVAAVAVVALIIVGYAIGASGIGIASVIGTGGNYNTGYAAGMVSAQRKTSRQRTYSEKSDRSYDRFRHGQVG